MPRKAKHAQPELYPPGEHSHRLLVIRFDLALDGPANTAEVWTTVTTELGDQVACYGPKRLSCSPADASAFTRFAEQQVELLGSILRPF